MAILVQFVTSKVGLAAGRSLPELCRARFGRRVNVVLWLQVEAVAMLSFGIPFALVPLLLISRDRALFGEAANHRVTTTLLAVVTAVLIALNAFVLYQVLASVG